MIFKILDGGEAVLELRDEHSIVILEANGEVRLSSEFVDTQDHGLTRSEALARVENAMRR